MDSVGPPDLCCPMQDAIKSYPLRFLCFSFWDVLCVFGHFSLLQLFFLIFHCCYRFLKNVWRTLRMEKCCLMLPFFSPLLFAPFLFYSSHSHSNFFWHLTIYVDKAPRFFPPLYLLRPCQNPRFPHMSESHQPPPQPLSFPKSDLIYFIVLFGFSF